MFLVGTAALVYFMLGLWAGWSYRREPAAQTEESPVGARGALA